MAKYNYDYEKNERGKVYFFKTFFYQTHKPEVVESKFFWLQFYHQSQQKETLQQYLKLRLFRAQIIIYKLIAIINFDIDTSFVWKRSGG